jgi:hypothetical protein
MRNFTVLILSCAPVLAADTGIRAVTSVTTNVQSASVTTREVFTRDGQTNLVRETMRKAGAVQVRVHWFYRDGARLATYVATPDTSAFVPESRSRYAVSLEFGPSKEVRHASIGTNDGFMLDAFTCTNGIFYPDEIVRIREANAAFEEAIGKQPAPVTVQHPQFDIRSADVVTASVITVTAPDHPAEIALMLTDECVKRYESFAEKHAGQHIDLLANGKLLLWGLSPSSRLSTEMGVYIFTSVDDANTLAESLNKK